MDEYADTTNLRESFTNRGFLQKHRLLIVFTIITCFIVIISAGYMYFALIRSQSVIRVEDSVQKSEELNSGVEHQKKSPRDELKGDIRLLTHTNTNLSGFKFLYPSDWNLSENTNCDEACLSLVLAKNFVTIKIHAFRSQEIQGSSCSNSVSCDEIGGGWLRIMDSTGTFYTHSYVLNPISRSDLDFLNWGNYEDEWSHIYENSYKLCITDGVLSDIRINENWTYRFDNITVLTDSDMPTPNELQEEVDNIIKTIKIPHQDHLYGHR